MCKRIALNLLKKQKVSINNNIHYSSQFMLFGADNVRKMKMNTKFKMHKIDARKPNFHNWMKKYLQARERHLLYCTDKECNKHYCKRALT